MDLEQVNFGYSSKNIPIASPGEYLQRLIDRTRTFLKSARWRAFFHLNPHAKPQEKVTYGFKSPNNPDPVPELRDFEDKVMDLIENIQFHPKKHLNASEFQTKLGRDVKDIKSVPEVFVAADKSFNHYKTSPQSYKQFMEHNITKDYKVTQ